MTRVRADDYETKYQAILDSAAALFAEVGYPGAKLQDIARRCGATKSMLYHYFPTKDDLLLALLSEHLERLIADVRAAIQAADPAPVRFAAFVRAYVNKSSQSRQRHLSAMNDIKFLPPAMQTSLQQKQRNLVDLVSTLLKHLDGSYPHDRYKPYSLLLLGMLNWTDLWFRQDGPMSADELCRLIADLFQNGFLGEQATRLESQTAERPRAAGRSRVRPAV